MAHLALIAAAALFESGELPAPAGINHGQAIVQLPSRALLGCWYSGRTEAGRDARILCARSADQGRTWNLPQTVVAPGEQARGARARNKSVGNVTLFEDGRARLWMIYGVIQSRRLPLAGEVCRNWRCGRVDAKVSLDEGLTWSKAARFDDLPGALPRAKPLALPGGGELVPLYLETLRRSYVRAARLPQSDPTVPRAGPAFPLNGVQAIQPALVLQADGRVRAFVRDPARVAVRTAVFDPAARRWSAPQTTNLPNPSSAVDAFADDAGDFVLIYNPSRRDRAALSLASSKDGTTFSKGCDLVPANAQGDVAYPSVIRAADRTWHVVYSSDGKHRVRHVRFDATWLGRCLGG